MFSRVGLRLVTAECRRPGHSLCRPRCQQNGWHKTPVSWRNASDSLGVKPTHGRNQRCKTNKIAPWPISPRSVLQRIVLQQLPNRFSPWTNEILFPKFVMFFPHDQKSFPKMILFRVTASKIVSKKSDSRFPNEIWFPKMARIAFRMNFGNEK